MAHSFSANQYENAFIPHRLRNYEVPQWYPKHPNTLCKGTRIIGNDRGHQLPIAKRPPCNPWGYHLNTWQLPMRITAEIAAELRSPHPERMANWQRHVEAAATRCGRVGKNGKKIASDGYFRPQPPPEDMVYLYCPSSKTNACEIFTMHTPVTQQDEQVNQVEINQQRTTTSPKQPMCPVHGAKKKKKPQDTTGNA